MVNAAKETWLTPAETATALKIGYRTVCEALNAAADAGEDVIFGHIHFLRAGGGESRPRYRVRGSDVLGTSKGEDSE